MATAILNFHFDYWHTSLIFILIKGCFEWDGRHVLSQVKGLVKYKFVFQVCYKDLTSHGKEIALD